MIGDDPLHIQPTMSGEISRETKAQKNQEFLDSPTVKRFYVVRQHTDDDGERWSVGVGVDGEILLVTEQFATAAEAFEHAQALPVGHTCQ